MNLTSLLDRWLEYARVHEEQIEWLAIALGAAIAILDWLLVPAYALAILYIVPLLMLALAGERFVIVGMATVFSLLAEQFSAQSLAPGRALRLAVYFSAFSGMGLFVCEVVRNRHLALSNFRRLQEEAARRQRSSRWARLLIETSPLAVFVVGPDGRILIANRSAHQLLGVEKGSLRGQDIREYVPLISRPLQRQREVRNLRVFVECSGYRKDGEVFLAQVWFSAQKTPSGKRVTAMVWDGSEDLRTRGGANLDLAMRTSRALMGAISHEIRNLAAAAAAAHRRLERTAAAELQEEIAPVGALVRALEDLASKGLTLSAGASAETGDLERVLDEFRIVVDPMFREIGADLRIDSPAEPLIVAADQNTVLQVLMNLARNARRALETAAAKRFEVRVSTFSDRVSLAVTDSGPGIAHPEELFRLFRGSGGAGLGLYLSRALVRSRGGDLRYETTTAGSRFVVELPRVKAQQRAAGA
ncbi:MAG TPA: PAS domain-containing sensor histidine kinase [Bryobacteraceae bacterium]|nr:PAS domain-containing sensor histidine kinase [Bryobacteraceae bacterium]